MTTTSPFLAFTAAAVARAHAEWGLNCAGAALAACLGLTLDAVRPFLGDIETRGYANPSMMARAVMAAGFRCYEPDSSDLPRHGLARVQWTGPWLLPGVPAKAAYRYTHWVGAKWWNDGCWVYDVNSGWVPLIEWQERVAPAIVASIPRASGGWAWATRWEVRKRP